MPDAAEQRACEAPVPSVLRALMVDSHFAEFQDAPLVEARTGRHPGRHTPGAHDHSGNL
jgi:hypothetical protein